MSFMPKQRSKIAILALILVVFSLATIFGCAKSSSNTTDVTLDGEAKQTTNEAEQRECKHSYKLASTTEPTCTAMGVSVYVCEHCESSREENVAALGHQKKTVPAKEGNCTEFGLSEGEICSRCNITLKAQQQTWKQEHNHDFADGYCTRCLERQSIEVSKYTLSEDKKSYILSVGGFTSEIKVRETFNGLPVSDIDLKALTSLNFVEKIIISDSVSQNKSSLFYGIKVLKTKTSGNLKYFASDNNDQFILVKCTNQSVSNINIAEGTEIIAPGAFSGCKSLKSVSLPSTIKRIERAAFEYCSALGSIDIPNGTEYIGGYAFYGCTSLTELHFPDSVTEIGTNAMQSCSSLKTVTLSRSLDKISDGLFNLCSSLKKVTMHHLYLVMMVTVYLLKMQL